MADTVALVFRYDDYHASFGPESRAKDDIERRFLATFAEHEVPITLGVVPNYERRRSLAADATRLDALRECVAGGRGEAALHGLTHESFAPEGSRSSEFAGQPREQQLERLRTGKAMLEEWVDAPVVSFIPPWNTFDEATVGALADLGFRALSAALSGPAVGEPVVAVPHTCGLGELRRTLRWLARRGGTAIVVCMFHHFSFGDSPEAAARRTQLSLAGLGELLGWCRGRPGVEFVTVGEAAGHHREALLDGRVDEARERWRLVFAWRRVRVLGRVLRRLWAPRALVEPGAWARGNRWLRRLSRAEGRK